MGADIPSLAPDSAALDTALGQLRQSTAERMRGIPAAPKSLDEIQKKATEFEAVFASQMLAHMFKKSVPTDSLTGGGHGEEAFRTLLVDEYGKALAGTGTLGIADAVAAEMLKAQSGER